MNLENKNIKWAEFIIGEEFSIKNTKPYHKKDLTETNNNGISYISRTNLNNGVESIVENKDFKLNKGNAITFGGENATFFYQPNKYIAGNNISYIESEKINKHTGLFIQRILNKSILGAGFGYGKGLIGSRVEKRIILLPTNSKGEPDYDFMEAFMKQKEADKKEKYKNYILKSVEQLKNFKEVEPLHKKDWNEFFLNEIFSKIQRGKRLKKEDHIKGQMPYVSSSSLNNGIDGFVSNHKSVRIFSNCLSLANSGSVGATFYQPFEFVASDHITKIENPSFNQYIYLFISTITKRLNEKYSFNREINDQRIKREKILLPTNKNGQPDFDYMENYIKKIEYQKLTKYLERKTPKDYK